MITEILNILLILVLIGIAFFGLTTFGLAVNEVFKTIKGVKNHGKND